jgi:hypothetical protein
MFASTIDTPQSIHCLLLLALMLPMKEAYAQQQRSAVVEINLWRNVQY